MGSTKVRSISGASWKFLVKCVRKCCRIFLLKGDDQCAKHTETCGPIGRNIFATVETWNGIAVGNGGKPTHVGTKETCGSVHGLSTEGVKTANSDYGGVFEGEGLGRRRDDEGSAQCVGFFMTRELRVLGARINFWPRGENENVMIRVKRKRTVTTRPRTDCETRDVRPREDKPRRERRCDVSLDNEMCWK